MMARVRTFLRVAAAAGLTALVAACVSPPPVADGGSDEITDAFARTGRFAVRVEAPGEQPEAVQGGFAWRDQGRRLVLDLANPFGSTLARMEATPQGAVLTRANGEVFRAANPDALIAEVLGGDIPVSGLRDWLRGRLAADPAAQDVRQDDAGRPTAFRQGGWQAALSRYDTQGPQLLVLERNEAGRRIVVRLVVDAIQP
ncbi:Outer membrane lipoprotein LolB [plant metagenome]|uniref:Outer-membrane lipoprotein LolB n=3 Tax=root TaxID=1 RepID=A0A1C3K310_9BURK|nr:Outer membrane lipoprotein LolB [Orrella dioscoreae]SOE51869.1 Outer membrane lipoprotein LolB [Orrella dioscoreae]